MVERVASPSSPNQLLSSYSPFLSLRRLRRRRQQEWGEEWKKGRRRGGLMLLPPLPPQPFLLVHIGRKNIAWFGVGEADYDDDLVVSPLSPYYY
uniref:Uncharacterized protein n=1 Tax=Ditylenchus dipsaci TaxID=166011 RepID=A0A915DC82_9BILA